MKIYLKNQQRSKKLNCQRIKKELAKSLRLLGLKRAEVSVLFVNSRKMRFLNFHYRSVDKSTDVISFPQHSSGAACSEKMSKNNGPCNEVLGDIVICIPKAQQQAEDFSVSFYDELLRLLIHGLLHLSGYDHEINRYQKNKMKKKEKELFYAVKKLA